MKNKKHPSNARDIYDPLKDIYKLSKN